MQKKQFFIRKGMLLGIALLVGVMTTAVKAEGLGYYLPFMVI